MTVAIDPLRFSATVPVAPEQAFDLFTARIASWWPLREISIGQDQALACFIEPFVGGRVYERSREGDEREWGKVLVFDRPRRISVTWHPSGGPVTEVEVNFTAADDGTYVELEHRGWEVFGEKAAEARDTYANGWPFVFGQRFVAAANA